MKKFVGAFLFTVSLPFGFLACSAVRATTRCVYFHDDLSTVAIALLFAVIFISAFLGLAATGMLFLTRK